MKIELSVDSYKGVDGSSLSQTRCEQIILCYNFLETLGDKTITYVDIQNFAEQKHIFGSTKAKSAIRTFFPLLRKLSFVNYDGYFPANKCFTKLGKQFVFAIRALEKIDDTTPHREEVINKLQDIKKNTIRQGIINMNSDPECKEHNIWVAFKLLDTFQIIHWNEFLYALYCIEKGKTIEDAILDIQKDKERIDKIVFVNEEQKTLPNTCYSYIRSLLVEAELISNINSYVSKTLDSFPRLYSQLNI